ncbi:hypothetical protein H7B90_16115 [Cohnella xylanilytica]|uniref:Uncharacterized protein n=1 Tax=Cohnella xylanilytica TaxID=557555 RepID=A0A841U3N8_9BACL|nr:CBO0543 family protein [Cohnella xylanilytica]MBB6692933.1 hypothetical protein [Cohnella xylanilytica]
MTKEIIIVIAVWIVSGALVVLSTPRRKIREALVVFLYMQMLTWFFGLLVAQYRLIEYPVREFSYATRSSFSFEFFIYPAICVVFNMRYPQTKGIVRGILWYLFFPSWMTAIEKLIEDRTRLIDYIHWEWYWTWITLLITFWLSRAFYLWFIQERTGGKRRP